MTTVIFSGALTGLGTPLKYLTGRTDEYRSRACLSATFRLLIPPPTGVVSGPLRATPLALICSRVAFGSHSPVALKDASPARIVSHCIETEPSVALVRAASIDDLAAEAISGPIPSPWIIGIVILSIFIPQVTVSFTEGQTLHASSDAGSTLRLQAGSASSW